MLTVHCQVLSTIESQKKNNGTLTEN